MTNPLSKEELAGLRELLELKQAIIDFMNSRGEYTAQQIKTQEAESEKIRKAREKQAELERQYRHGIGDVHAHLVDGQKRLGVFVPWELLPTDKLEVRLVNRYKTDDGVELTKALEDNEPTAGQFQRIEAHGVKNVGSGPFIYVDPEYLKTLPPPPILRGQRGPTSHQIAYRIKIDEKGWEKRRQEMREERGERIQDMRSPANRMRQRNELLTEIVGKK